MRKMGGQEYFLTYLLLHPIVMVLVTPPPLLTLVLVFCSIEALTKSKTKEISPHGMNKEYNWWDTPLGGRI
jgi:hypothetical protein